MLDIIGKDVKLWVNSHEGRKGRWNSYSISISKKTDDKYINKGVKMVMGKDIEVPIGIRNGDRIDFQGFPTLDIYTDKDGNEHRDIVIYAKTVRFLDHEEEDDTYEGYENVQEEIPF